MEQPSELILFFGRFHPLVLHLPIGFLLLAFILELLSRFKKFEAFKSVVGFVLSLGIISAIISAILGLMLAQGGGYGEDLLSLHQWLGIATSLVACIALVIRMQAVKNNSPVLDKAYLSFMALMTVLLMGTGHYGGSLTHGSDYLTQYMPNTLRRVAGMDPRQEKKNIQITNLQEADVYHDVIFPIIDNNCTSCHNPDKKKGELMMHTTEALMDGGEDGPVLVAGSSAKSHMIKRLLLPESDEEHMPPDGKRPLSDEQIKLLSWWIDEGAPFNKQIAQVTLNPDIQNILDALVDPNAHKTAAEILLTTAVAAAEEQVLDQIEQQGIQLYKVADNVNWLHARIAFNQVGDSLVPLLKPVAQQLVALNIGNTNTTDYSLAAIAEFKKLTRLHLENTQITDAGIEHLTGLDYLEYLNLYGTSITDASIAQLERLKNLRKVYLWKTGITEEGLTQLQQSLPDLEISSGVDKGMTEKKTAQTGSDSNNKPEQVAVN